MTQKNKFQEGEDVGYIEIQNCAHVPIVEIDEKLTENIFTLCFLFN